MAVECNGLARDPGACVTREVTHHGGNILNVGEGLKRALAFVLRRMASTETPRSLASRTITTLFDHHQRSLDKVRLRERFGPSSIAQVFVSPIRPHLAAT